MIGWLVIGGFVSLIYFVILVVKKVCFEITKIKTTACYTELIDSTPSTLGSSISNIYNLRVDTSPVKNVKFYEELKRIDDDMYEDSKIKLNTPFKVYWDENTERATSVTALNKDICFSALFPCAVFLLLVIMSLADGTKWFGFIGLCLSAINLLVLFWTWKDDPKKEFYHIFSIIGLVGLFLASLVLVCL